MRGAPPRQGRCAGCFRGRCAFRLPHLVPRHHQLANVHVQAVHRHLWGTRPGGGSYDENSPVMAQHSATAECRGARRCVTSGFALASAAMPQASNARPMLSSQPKEELTQVVRKFRSCQV